MKTQYLRTFAKHIASGIQTIVKLDFGVTWDSANGWNSLGGGGGGTRYPGSDVNWESEAGTLWLNSVISICLQYIYDKVVEPRVHVVYEDGEGMLQPVPKHPCSELMLHPNPEYHGNALLQALALSYKCAGTAYAMKIRGNGGTGVPIEIWYVPHWLMWPMVPANGGPTEFYAYKEPQPTGGYKMKAIPARNVICIKNGLDPENSRIGLNPTRAQFRPIVSDNEIDSTVALVLKNRGNIGVVVTPADSDIELTPDQERELKRKIDGASQGDARGSMIALSVPIKVDRVTQSPRDLMLNEVGNRPTARLCAMWNIDPMAVNLGSTESGKGGQYGTRKKQAMSSTYEGCILPTLAAIAEAMTYQLLVDFPQSARPSKMSRRVKRLLMRKRWAWKGQSAGPSNTRDFRVNFDYSEVSDMAEDKSDAYKRAVEIFGGNLVTLDEGREEIGLKPAADPNKGGLFSFELLPAPGGEFGVLPGPDDPQTPPIVDEPDSDPDDEDLPEEQDEDFEG